MLMFILRIWRWYLEQSGVPADLGPMRVFQYISVRAGAALITAFVISLVAGPWIINRLRLHSFGQVVRKSTGEGAVSLHAMHGAKEGTPTMGGLLIIFALMISVLIFCRLTTLVLSLMAVTLAFGALGFRDDYLKIIHGNHKGLSPRKKLLVQMTLGLGLGLLLWLGDWSVTYHRDISGAGPVATRGYAYLLVPFLKNLYIPLGAGFILFAAFVMTCTSNAVNLTDGLDGLAIGVTLTSVAAFTIIAYLTSREDLSRYLYIPHVAESGELVVFGGAILGALFGFLWFNSHPAEVFMGDTGSMMLGGALGAMALMVKHELLLVLIGGVFVVEAVSVILQVVSFKTTGKRIFRMAPLHHHYEKLGLHESKIIIRFWTIAVLLALLGLATLKLR